jgi:hypothetical protein
MKGENTMNFETFTSQICLLTDEELKELSERCCELYERRTSEKRKELKNKLGKNLLKAIEDVLNNDFTLLIEKKDYPGLYLYPDKYENCEVKIK